MENFYQGNRFYYYNNYNNIGNMDLYPIDNINESPYGNNYKDIMLEEAKRKRQKKIIKSNDRNINNLFDFNRKDNFQRFNYTDKKNNNNSFWKLIDKYSNINKELYKNVMNNNYNNNYRKNNDNININTETKNKFNNQNINSPYRYKPKYPKSNKINNNKFDYIIKKQPQEQNHNPRKVRERYNFQQMNNDTNISLNINNENNFIFSKFPNMIYRAENPNQKINNNFNRDSRNNFKQPNNKIERKKDNINKNIFDNMNKRKVDEDNEDEENLSNLADDLYNLGQENKVKKNSIKKNINNNNNKNLNNKTDNNNNININIKKEVKEKEIIINNVTENKESSTKNKNNQVEEVGCQAINSDFNIKMDIKYPKVDSSNDIQISLMPTFPVKNFNFEISKVNYFNIIDPKKEEIKIDESKKFSENSPTDFIVDKEKKDEEIKIINQSNNVNNKNRKNSSNNLSEKIIYDRSQSEKSKELGYEIIDSEKEKEIEEREKKKKKNRRIKIDENQNIYFNFLQNDIITACQVKKGKKGILEMFEPKSDEDKMDSLIIFELKSAIKDFKKEEIRIDKTYKLRENMEEWRIIPELYEDEEEVDDNIVNDLANSLTSSIDKSTKASINESLRKSITQSYNHSMIGSLISSINNTEGQGILKKLTSAFGESLNLEE